jgi:hypothetical protein
LPPGGLAELVEPVITSLLLLTCPPGVVAEDELPDAVPALEVPEVLAVPLAPDVAFADSRVAGASVFDGPVLWAGSFVVCGAGTTAGSFCS